MSDHPIPDGPLRDLDTIIPNESDGKSQGDDINKHDITSSAHVNQIVGSAKSIVHRLRRKHARTLANGAAHSDSSDDEHGESLETSSDLSNGNEADTQSALTSTARKPLPPLPSIPPGLSNSGQTHHEPQFKAHQHPINRHAKPLPASADVDVDNMVDTLQHTHLAPAVTQETIQPVIHDIRKEQITRDIHNFDIIHREQPIIETEVLPARHFVLSPSGVRQEVPAASLPEFLRAGQDERIREALCRDSASSNRKML